MSRLRWLIVASVPALGILIALLAVSSVTTCPSCVEGPCPCTTDYRIWLRLVIVIIALLVAVAVWYVTRRRMGASNEASRVEQH